MNRLLGRIFCPQRVEAVETPAPCVHRCAVGRSCLSASLSSLAQMTTGGGSQNHSADRCMTPFACPRATRSIGQVENNLLENADQIMVRRRRRSTVTVGARHSGCQGPARARAVLRITFQRQGAGIDPLHLPRLTERFLPKWTSTVRGRNGRNRAWFGNCEAYRETATGPDGIIHSQPGTGSQFSVILQCC